MVRAGRNVRMVSLDERDHALLLSLLEHKVLTTHQIKSLFFRSFRRCQHRMKELRELDLVSSFSVGRGFGEGRPPACWFLTKAGLSEIAEARDIRPSLGTRSQLPVEPAARPPPRGERVLLRPRRGLQGP